jgi:hypothetical protein
MGVSRGAHDPSARYAGTCAILAASGQNANFADSAKGRNYERRDLIHRSAIYDADLSAVSRRARARIWASLVPQQPPSTL